MKRSLYWNHIKKSIICIIIIPEGKERENGTEKKRSWVLVAHACNPSYSGGRDQEGCGLKPTWANSSQDPILKKPITKQMGWWSGSRCRP
jgi:hypothetical protein